MTFGNWPNSAPLPSSQAPVYASNQFSSDATQAQPNIVNSRSNPFSAYGVGPTYNLYTHTSSGAQVRSSPGRHNMSNMNSMALVEALLAPTPVQREVRSPHRMFPSTPPQLLRSAYISSPLSEPHNNDLSSDIGERQSHASNTKRKNRSRKRTYSTLPDPESRSAKRARSNAYTPPATSLKARRSSKAGKKPLPQETQTLKDEEDDTVKHASGRKTAAQAKRSKDGPKRLVRKKPQGTKVPETLSEAGTADRMMWAWKNSGRDWEDIRNEWAKITGIKPGKSSLSVRYIKLNENFARHGAAGDLELIRFRKEAEDELMASVWDKVAGKMLAYNQLSEHNPKDLAKRYDLLVRSGFDIQKLLDSDIAKKQNEQAGAQDKEAADTSMNKEVEEDLENKLIQPNCVNNPLPSAASVLNNEHFGTDVVMMPYSRSSRNVTDGTFDYDAADTFRSTSYPRLHFPETSIVFKDLEDNTNLEAFNLDPQLGKVDQLAPNLQRSGTPPVNPANTSLVTYASDSD